MKFLLTLCLPFLILYSSSCQQAASAKNTRAEPKDAAWSRHLTEMESALASGQLSTSDILTDREWMKWHSVPEFRALIKKNATPGLLRMTAKDEPGLPIQVEGILLDPAGTPIADALVYVYHTDDKGWYADTAAHILAQNGDMDHARLFGYLRTDREGKFSIATIRPRGYPKTDLAAHIHIAFWDREGQPIYGGPQELLFDEDERLSPSKRKQALQSGFLIASNSGTKQHYRYQYKIVISRD